MPVLVVVRARDLRSNAKSLEQRLIKPDGAAAAGDSRSVCLVTAGRAEEWAGAGRRACGWCGWP